MQLMTGNIPCRMLLIAGVSWRIWSCKSCAWLADNRIRHIPVIDDKEMMGMVSIGDVVRAVVSEHREELDRLNAYIQGGY